MDWCLVSTPFLAVLGTGVTWLLSSSSLVTPGTSSVPCGAPLEMGDTWALVAEGEVLRLWAPSSVSRLEPVEHKLVERPGKSLSFMCLLLLAVCKQNLLTSWSLDDPVGSCLLLLESCLGVPALVEAPDSRGEAIAEEKGGWESLGSHPVKDKSRFSWVPSDMIASPLATNSCEGHNKKTILLIWKG